MNEFVIAGITGLASGTLASLVAPWAQWGVEKRRQKLNNRAETIQKWRADVRGFDFASGSIESSIFYSTIRPHLEQQVIDKIEDSTTIYGGNRTDTRSLLMDEITRIEKEWNLI